MTLSATAGAAAVLGMCIACTAAAATVVYRCIADSDASSASLVALGVLLGTVHGKMGLVAAFVGEVFREFAARTWAGLAMAGAGACTDDGWHTRTVGERAAPARSPPRDAELRV